MKRIPILIPDNHHELLRQLAHDNRTSIAEEIRKAISQYLKEEQNNAHNRD